MIPLEELLQVLKQPDMGDRFLPVIYRLIKKQKVFSTEGKD